MGGEPILLLSGYSALSEYSMLNPSAICYLAADSVTVWKTVASRRLHNSDEQYAVELWRYDPKKLVEGECVDRLSLALALREDRDERIEEAVEKMLVQVWGISMVRGIESFREWFRGYEEQYAIIGGQVDSKNIRKHRNDVFRLTELLDQIGEIHMSVPDTILTDMRAFAERMVSEDVDLKQLGILDKTKEDILDELRFLYG